MYLLLVVGGTLVGVVFVDFFRSNDDEHQLNIGTVGNPTSYKVANPTLTINVQTFLRLST